MKTALLGNVAVIERHAVDPLSLPPETPYLGLEHIERGGRIIGRGTVAGSLVSSTKFEFTPDHVLYGKLRPNLGKVSRPDFSGVCSTDILPIRPGPELDRGYLAHYLALPTMVGFAASRASGANLPRLSPSVLAAFAIPLPSLCEQRRIARILDQAAMLRAKHRQLLTKVDVLDQAMYEHILGDHDWPRLKIGSIASKVGSGATPRGGSAAYKKQGVALIRSMNIHDGRFVWKDLDYLDDDQANCLSNVVVEADDVLLNITGASVARVSRAPASVLPARVNQHVAIIRPKPGSIHPRVLERHLLSPRVKRVLLNVAGSGATRDAITRAQILELQIPLPDEAAQEHYLATAATVARQRMATQSAIDAADGLFASLQSRAFRGEL